MSYRSSSPSMSLTWDRGKELAAHAAFQIETGVSVFFADPYSRCSAAATRTL
jgi:IS30 family transposase